MIPAVSCRSRLEDSLYLSVATFVKKKGTVGSWSRGSLKWSYEGCEPHARISYEANLIDPNAAWVRLTYAVNGTPMEYRVRLVTTQPTYGGRRWWFLMPAGAPGWRTAAARGEALPAAGREVFRKSSGLWSHPHLVPGEWEIRRALSSSRRCALNRRGSRAACAQAALGLEIRRAFLKFHFVRHPNGQIA